MNWNYFIGIDVSKATLDLCILNGKEKLVSFTIDNNNKALSAFWRQLLKNIPSLNGANAVFCMEHTGIYNEHLVSFLLTKKASICVEHPAHLKLCVGLTRGKNDQIDAFRIATYAYKERESLKLWNPPRPIIKTLKHLVSLRSRLIKSKKSLSVPVKEMKLYDKERGKIIAEICKNTLKQIDLDLKSVEGQIHAIINDDPVLNRLFKISTSVSGIGPVTALEIIISTNEFKNINTAKKFACYAEIVPFDHSSGSSLRSRARVSHRANKRVKMLLHMSAVASLVSGDMKKYYERKVEEGKHKMSIINAVRNKLILRLFSCVKNDRIYQKNHEYRKLEQSIA